jgi:zinc transporter ZupT
MHLLPDIYESENQNIGLFIMLGILFQIVLEFFSKGAEHGHVHGHETMNQIPWLLFISLCIHAFLEGFPVSHHHDLAIGIAIHHLPIAIILTTFFINANLNKKAIFFFMITFAVMTPLGTILSDYLPILNEYYTEITAIVIGILFHISSTIIFESSEGHKFNIAKVSMIVIGIALAYFI